MTTGLPRNSAQLLPQESVPRRVPAVSAGFVRHRTHLFHRRLRRSLVGEPHFVGGMAPPGPQRTQTHDFARDNLPGAFK